MVGNTLLLRRDVALRNYRAFLQSWDQGADVMPEWRARLSAVATRLRRADFPDRQARKVFGIGLSKTGTTSLAAALDILGWQTAHFRNPITNAIIEEADFDLFDALNDGPVSACFETLYARYPNALFVWTKRPLESWEASVRGHRMRVRGTDAPRDLDAIAAAEGLDSPLTFRLAIHDAIWRQPDLATVHGTWERRVMKFFEDKPGKLLPFNIFDGDGWPELCGFLGCEQPEKDFPHANRADNKQEAGSNKSLSERSPG